MLLGNYLVSLGYEGQQLVKENYSQKLQVILINSEKDTKFKISIANQSSAQNLCLNFIPSHIFPLLNDVPCYWGVEPQDNLYFKIKAHIENYQTTLSNCRHERFG